MIKCDNPRIDRSNKYRRVCVCGRSLIATGEKWIHDRTPHEVRPGLEVNVDDIVQTGESETSRMTVVGFSNELVVVRDEANECFRYSIWTELELNPCFPYRSNSANVWVVK